MWERKLLKGLQDSEELYERFLIAFIFIIFLIDAYILVESFVILFFGIILGLIMLILKADKNSRS